MNLVKMTHTSGLTAEVPASAVAQHAMAGWVVDESQTPPPCPACGRPWPTVSPPQKAEQQDPAPAESGASSSEPPRRRKTSRTESDL